MALDLKVGILNNKASIIITEDTGDYNAVSNITGWGAPNYAYTNPPVTALALNIYYPGSATVSIGPVNLLGTTYFTSADRAYDLTSSLTLQDGVWKYIVTYTIIVDVVTEESVDYVVTKYALRDNDIKCKIGQLALGDMTSNSYEEFKIMYDKMVQAFECEEYVLAQELYEEINDMFTDCAPYSVNCNC